MCQVLIDAYLSNAQLPVKLTFMEIVEGDLLSFVQSQLTAHIDIYRVGLVFMTSFEKLKAFFGKPEKH